MNTLTPTTANFALWQQVPQRVADLTPKAIKAGRAHSKAAEVAGLLATSAASWAPDTDTITVHTAELPTRNQQAMYRRKIASDYTVEFSCELPTVETAVLVKKAVWFPNVNAGWRYANNALGGPTPLSNAIVTGLALGGLGYGAGALAEQVVPERFLERGSLRKPLAMLGALGGFGTAAIQASATSKLYPENGYWKAWLTDNRTEPLTTPPSGEKASEFKSMTGIYKPYIPVDAFNRATWADASKNYDQSSYANHTSPQIAAATTGIMSGIKQQTGDNLISPYTVIRGLASAGIGLAAATIAGKTIGALGGLTPVAQENIQNMGLWGGLLHAVIPPLLRW